MSDHQRPEEITALLNRGALEEVMPHVEAELRRLARSYMRREPSDHTLQSTALVNEAYLRLVDQESVQWQNRAHFFGIAARQMRRILVDHARRRHSLKRGAGQRAIPIDEAQDPGNPEPAFSLEDSSPETLLDLNNALERLEAIDVRQSHLVELKHFGGLTIRESAEVLNISVATVKRELRAARVWLYRDLTRRGSSA